MGKSSKPKTPSAAMPDTENMKYARKNLYPILGQALAGRGFGNTNLRERDALSAYGDAHKTARSGMMSEMFRTVAPEDSRVKSHLSNMMARTYTTGRDEIRRSFRQERTGDTDLAQGMATEMLSNEKRMGVSSARLYNRALARADAMTSQYGTEAANIAGGIGSGMMDYYYAQKWA